MLSPFHENAINMEIKSNNHYKGHNGSVGSVCFDIFDANKFWSGSYDHTIKLWDIQTAKCISTIENHSLGVWSIDVSSRSKVIASTSPDATIVLSDAITGKKVSEFKGKFTKGYWVEFSADGSKLVASGMDGSVQLFDVKKGALMKDFALNDAIVYNSKFVSSSEILCCTSKGEILLFDDSLNLLDRQQITDRELRSVAYKNGKLYASLSANQISELIYDLQNKTIKLNKQVDAHLEAVSVIETCNQRNLVFTGCKDSTLHAWDGDTLEFKNNLVGHTDQISDITIQKNGSLLLSASWDQSLRCYDISEISD